MSVPKFDIPFGYTTSGKKVTFMEVKDDIQSANIRPTHELSSNQRKDLTIDCCNHDTWSDIAMGSVLITKTKR